MEFIFCKECGKSIWYDKECTIYLKCPNCNYVLVDVDVRELWRNCEDIKVTFDKISQ